MFFVDDGISGTSFERSGFQQMQRMAKEGKICRIIVKDLSRFGREQVEAGRLTQIVYPSLGITFISIQENVNSSTGDGMEMLPFYNIFYEWYAAQTSKKIRAVWQSKAEHGERVSPSVPFGYKKSENNPKQWVVDEPAAEVTENRQTLQSAELKAVNLRLVLRTLREMTDVKELTPTIVNSLIERIEVHNNDKYDGHCHVKVDIYFTAVGMIDIPTEKEIRAILEEMRKNPQEFKFVA